MKRSIHLFLIVFLSLNHLLAQKPEAVYSIAKEKKPHSFFVEQAELWWKEIEKNEKNEKLVHKEVAKSIILIKSRQYI